MAKNGIPRPRRLPRSSLVSNQERRAHGGRQALFFDSSELEVPVRRVSTGTNFVPSFSVVRFPTDLEALDAMRHRVGKALKGSGFWVTKPEGLAVKSLSQRKFIDLARDAGSAPAVSDMQDLVHTLRGDLAELLGDSPPGIELPLGQVSTFGFRNNVLGVGPRGWRGHGARYAVHGEDGSVHPVGILAAEGQISMDALTLLMGKAAPEFDASELATMPHLSICRRRSEIQEHDLRRARSVLEDELDDTLALGDPVIYFRAVPEAGAEIIPIRPGMVDASVLGTMALSA